MPPTLAERPEEVVLTVTLRHVVAAHMAFCERAPFFVQVGAFDGKDHLRELVFRYDLAGILAEPQSGPFAALQATYAGRPKLKLRNVAVSEHDETRPFYTVSGPPWTAELASFDVDTILSHDTPELKLSERLTRHEVSCESFETLLAGVEQVDLLQIDAEGYDARLLELFDFERWQPSIIQFEHRHLSMADHEAAVALLVERGFLVALSHADTIAHRPQVARL